MIIISVLSIQPNATRTALSVGTYLQSPKQTINWPLSNSIQFYWVEAKSSFIHTLIATHNVRSNRNIYTAF